MVTEPDRATERYEDHKAPWLFARDVVSEKDERQLSDAESTSSRSEVEREVQRKLHQRRVHEKDDQYRILKLMKVQDIWMPIDEIEYDDKINSWELQVRARHLNLESLKHAICFVLCPSIQEVILANKLYRRAYETFRDELARLLFGFSSAREDLLGELQVDETRDDVPQYLTIFESKVHRLRLLNKRWETRTSMAPEDQMVLFVKKLPLVLRERLGEELCSQDFTWQQFRSRVLWHYAVVYHKMPLYLRANSAVAKAVEDTKGPSETHVAPEVEEVQTKPLPKNETLLFTNPLPQTNTLLLNNSRPQPKGLFSNTKARM